SKRKLMVDILSQDAIGKYLSSDDSDEVLKSSSQSIVDIAKKNDISIYTIFGLLRVYFMCVASTHTKDATGQTGLMDTIGMFDFSKPGILALSPEYEEKLQKLRYETFGKALVNTFS